MPPLCGGIGRGTIFVVGHSNPDVNVGANLSSLSMLDSYPEHIPSWSELELLKHLSNAVAVLHSVAVFLFLATESMP